MLFHDLLLPDGILGTQDSGLEAALGTVGFLKRISFSPSTDSYFGTVAFLNDEPKVSSIRVGHCKHLSAVVSLILCALGIRGNRYQVLKGGRILAPNKCKLKTFRDDPATVIG